MKKLLLIAAAVGALATPALADEVGVRVGPVGAGVTVGEGHRDYDRDRVREKTVIKQHEPSDRTTVIKKEHGDGVESRNHHSPRQRLSLPSRALPPWERAALLWRSPAFRAANSASPAQAPEVPGDAR